MKWYDDLMDKLSSFSGASRGSDELDVDYTDDANLAPETSVTVALQGSSDDAETNQGVISHPVVEGDEDHLGIGA